MSSDAFLEIVEVDPSTAKVSGKAGTGADTGNPLPTGYHPVYLLRAKAKELLNSARLPARCWELLHRVDGKRDLLQLARAVEESPEVVANDCHRLVSMGFLIEADAISYEEFRGRRRRSKPSATHTMDAAEPAVTTAQESAAEVAIRSPARLAESVAEHPQMLATLMRLVRDARGGGRRGDLAVYLMFTRVPAELFREAGLRSFLYVDESTELKHKALAQRLLKEAELIVGHSVGEELAMQLAANGPRPN